MMHILYYTQHCSAHNLDWDCTTVQYYERLAQLQLHGDTITSLTLQSIFTQIQTAIAPHTMLRSWAQQVFPSSSYYWTFRQQVLCIYILILMTTKVTKIFSHKNWYCYMHAHNCYIHVYE